MKSSLPVSITANVCSIKKFIPSLLTLFLVILCFSPLCSEAQLLKKMKDKLEGKSTYLETDPYTFTPTSENINVPMSCMTFGWFKKGAEFIYRLRIPGQSIDKSLQYITKNLFNNGEAIVAESEIKVSSNNVHIDDGAYYTQFKCTGDILYVDVSGNIKAELKKLIPDLKINSGPLAERIGNNGFASYPISMTENQTLEDVNYIASSGGSPNIQISFTLTDRKVEGRETVSTSAGKFECFKVSALRTVTITQDGKTKDLTEPLKEYTWIAAKAGLVKQETYNKKGNLVSIFYVSSIK